MITVYAVHHLGTEKVIALFRDKHQADEYIRRDETLVHCRWAIPKEIFQSES